MYVRHKRKANIDVGNLYIKTPDKKALLDPTFPVSSFERIGVNGHNFMVQWLIQLCIVEQKDVTLIALKMESSQSSFEEIGNDNKAINPSDVMKNFETIQNRLNNEDDTKNIYRTI